MREEYDSGMGREDSNPLRPNGMNKTWRGCPNIRMIWKNDHSDTELEYDGYLADESEVEDYFLDFFLDERTEWTTDDIGKAEFEDAFNCWLQERENEVLETIQDLSRECL